MMDGAKREKIVNASDSLRFHWSLSQAGDKFRRLRPPEQMPGCLSLESQLELCRQGERCGIESMLMAIGFTRPDPTLLSIELGLQTEKMKFMIACRSGLISPTYWVQQINTASALLPGRICVNMVCGHTPHELRYYGDFLSHDERYERTDEFLAICRALWAAGPGGPGVDFQGKHYRVEKGLLRTPFVSGNDGMPEIFVGGNSDQAAALAASHGDCLWRFPDRDENLRPHCELLRSAHKQIGLLVSLITRPTHEEAMAACQELLTQFNVDARTNHQRFASRSDSVGFRSVYANAVEQPEWLTPWLWTGAVPYLGPPAIALVGSFQEVAAALHHYQSMGITQFLFTGWPDIEEMEYFGKGVLPLLYQNGVARESQA
jgi:alkanesulfonate monooxygenase